MKKARIYIWIGVVAVALICIKIFWLSPKKPTKQQPAGGQARPVNVTVLQVQPEKVNNKIFLTGTIKGNESVQLQSEMAGKIVGLYFSEGQSVVKGQLLVKLNDAEIQAPLRKLKSQLLIATDKEQRLKKLLTINAVSQEEYETAWNQMESLKADIDALQAQLEETEIRAPFSGTIGLRNVSIGSYVNTTTVIASLVQLNPVKLDFSLPEKYLRFIRRGDLVTFYVEGNKKAFSGKVYAIDPALDEATRSVRLRALCPNPGGELSPGSFAKIEFQSGAAVEGLMVPSEALVPDLKGQKVYIVSQGKAVAKPVNTGVRTEDKIEITQGLNAGDSVITSGLLQVKPGSDVRVINAAK